MGGLNATATQGGNTKRGIRAYRLRDELRRVWDADLSIYPTYVRRRDAQLALRITLEQAEDDLPARRRPLMFTRQFDGSYLSSQGHRIYRSKTGRYYPWVTEHNCSSDVTSFGLAKTLRSAMIGLAGTDDT